MKTPGKDPKRTKECGMEAAELLMEITTPFPLDQVEDIKLYAKIVCLAKILGIELSPAKCALSADRKIVRIGVFRTEADKDLMTANLHRLNEPEIEDVAEELGRSIFGKISRTIQ